MANDHRRRRTLYPCIFLGPRHHVVVLHGKIGDLEFKGYSAVEPGTELVNYIAFDNRGAISKGSWGMEDNELVLRVETRGTDRWKMAAVFTPASGGGLNVRVHRIDDFDNLVSPALTTLRFKKA